MNITGGIYNGRKISAPDEKITRPTLSKVRMAVFNTLFSLLPNFEERSFLDAFGGSGVMGLEALSRGFSDVTVFEKNIKSAEIIKKNYETLGLKPNLKIGDSLKLLQKLDKKFDVIYIDPPYLSGIYEKVFELVEKCSDENTIIVAEHSVDIEYPNLELVKSKNYGGKYISFFKLKN